MSSPPLTGTSPRLAHWSGTGWEVRARASRAASIRVDPAFGCSRLGGGGVGSGLGLRPPPVQVSVTSLPPPRHL